MYRAPHLSATTTPYHGIVSIRNGYREIEIFSLGTCSLIGGHEQAQRDGQHPGLSQLSTIRDDSFHINHPTSVFRQELFTQHTIPSAVLPAAHRCAAMPGRKSSTCKSLGSALCENCRSTRKLKCLNFGAAAAALAPLRAAESGAVMRRLQRRRRWLSLSTPLPATSGSPTRGWEVGSTLARRTLRSLAPPASKPPAARFSAAG